MQSSGVRQPFFSRAPQWRKTQIVLRRALALLLLLPTFAGAAELKIATWNLEWLTDRAAHDPALPPDVVPKRAEDIDTLRRYALELDADVVAIQEVDGTAIAGRVFPPDRYSIHMTHDDVVQRVGVAVRRGIRYQVNPDVTALQLSTYAGLRSGADVTLLLTPSPLRVLSIHLKTGCFDKRFNRSSGRSCSELRQQVTPLAAWIAARRAEGIAFVVLGDFNRRMEGRDQFWAALRQAAPLTRATEDRSSPCLGGEAFVDHIVLGGAARDWMIADTLRVLLYREPREIAQQRLSDHCPVSVRLRLPD